MPLANLGDFYRGVTIASPDLAQVLPRHAIEAIERFRIVAGAHQKFVERSPIVSPVKVEAYALAKFFFVNLPAPPFVKNVLVARKDGFDSQDNWPVAGKRAVLQQRRG